jgi:hypothetical protein
LQREKRQTGLCKLHQLSHFQTELLHHELNYTVRKLLSEKQIHKLFWPELEKARLCFKLHKRIAVEQFRVLFCATDVHMKDDSILRIRAASVCLLVGMIDESKGIHYSVYYPP